MKLIPLLALQIVFLNALATPADKLKAKLKETVESGCTYFGHHDDPVYGHDWVGDEGRSDVLEITGSYPGMMSWDLGKLEWGNAENLDGVPFERMRQEVINQDKRGGINTFSWHLDNPLTGEDSWNTEDKTLVERIVHTNEGQVAFRKQLDFLANFFNSLVDENGEKIAVIFRPFHEHTGNWFWWGRDNCTAVDYKALWGIMREQFDARGVDNVVWAYSPDRCASEEMYFERYPGDGYVDILGADVYHFGGEKGINQYVKSVETTLGIAKAEAAKRGKIAAFTETGLESIPIDDWYMSVLMPLLQRYRPAYVVVWRNAHDKPDHFYAPYPGHPSADAFKKFAENPQMVFVGGRR